MLITIFLVLVTNPQLWPEPGPTLQKILITSSNFNTWGGDIISNGQVFDGDRAPWWYQLSYLTYQAPIGYIIIYLIVGTMLVKNIKRIKDLNIITGLITLILIPLIYTILFRPTVYSGIRQILFVLPILIILLAHALKNIRFKANFLFYVAPLIYFFSILAFDAGKYPLNYVYYNELSYKDSVELNWELDYQGVSQEILQRQYKKMQPFIYPDNFVYDFNFETGRQGYEKIEGNSYYIKYRDLNLPWFNGCEKIDSVERTFYSGSIILAELRKCTNDLSYLEEKYKIEKIIPRNNFYDISINNFAYVLDKSIGRSICISGIFESKINISQNIDVKNFALTESKSNIPKINANRYSFLENREIDRSQGLVMQTSFSKGDEPRFLACFDSEKVKLNSGKKYELSYATVQIAYFRT
jgi:hypothetical protein